MIRIIHALLLIGLCSSAGAAEDPVVRCAHNESATVRAQEILAIEGESDPDSAVRRRLDRLMEGAIDRFDAGRLDGESETGRARRFFEAVDRALIEGDVIFPPILRDGLRPRVLSETEFTRAGARFANARRLPWSRGVSSISSTAILRQSFM